MKCPPEWARLRTPAAALGRRGGQAGVPGGNPSFFWVGIEGEGTIVSLRIALNEALKQAVRGRDELATSVLRLILAALKDRDIAERGKGREEGLSDEEVVGLLQSMVKQRRESIKMYEQGHRPELAGKEAAEIEIIEGFLPRQMGEDEIRAAVDATIAETGASALKDIGKVMALLRERYPGSMDFAKASACAKTLLSA